MIWKACYLNLVMTSPLASKCQDIRGLRDLEICQWRYHDQIYITRSSCHMNQVLKCWWEWQLSLSNLYPLEHNYAFHLINRPPVPNILVPSVLCNGLFILLVKDQEVNVRRDANRVPTVFLHLFGDKCVKNVICLTEFFSVCIQYYYFVLV